jgi:hypothetical protein
MSKDAAASTLELISSFILPSRYNILPLKLSRYLLSSLNTLLDNDHAQERAFNNLSRSKLKARLTEFHNAQVIALSVLSVKQGVPFSGRLVDNEAARFSARIEVDDALLLPESGLLPGESFRMPFPCLEQCLAA